MKTNKLIPILLLLIALGGCKETPPQKGSVEQNVTTDFKYNQQLCKCETCIETFAWYNGNIVWSSYRAITDKDSIIRADSLQAYSIIKKLDKNIK